MPFARSLAILSLLLLAAPAGAVTEADFCDPGVDPCEFNDSDALNVPENTKLNFGGRTLIIGHSRKIDITGGVRLDITAGTFIMRPGSRIGNAQTANGADLVVTTTGDIVMEQSVRESRSRVEVPGTVDAGKILFTAGGNIESDGELRANGIAADANGGLIDLEAAGDVTLAGPVNAAGDIAGLGGELVVGADGPIVVNAPVDCSGGLDGGDIDLSSNASVSTTEFLDVRGSVGGSGGGSVAIAVDGSITIGNKVFAQGVGTLAGGGGFGGEVDFEAGGSIFLNDAVDLSGGPPGGTGGFAFFGADVDIIQRRPVFGVGAGGEATGGDISYTAGRLLSLEAPNDVSASDAGGTFGGSARGEIQAKNDVVVSGTGIGGSAGTIDLDGLVPGVAKVSGNITITGALRAIGDTDGGSITLQGCNVTVPAGGVLNNAGAKSANAVKASGLMTITGRLTASPAPAGSNLLEFLNLAKPPVLTGATIDPAATPTRNPDLPDCQDALPSKCGDGELQSKEGCDDGNLDSCDGCSGGSNQDCHDSEGCCQEEACGNGRKDCNPATGRLEECDDGNVADGDGVTDVCDADCTNTRCGNGRTTGSEECDDGNNTNGDGCSSTCVIESPPGCGDHVVSDDEECDDGNQNSCDGCSKLCVIEKCGNGTKECGEVCDDGGTLPCDGECSADCKRVVDVCGDAIAECGEECDAGTANGAPGSACSGFCRTCAVGSGADCPCATDFDCAPAGRCAGLACQSGVCSPVAVPKCDDGNVCNGVEACVSGDCTHPTSLPCNDDDPCTDDTCTAVGGCPHARKTGFPGVSCRLDFIVAAADGATIADLDKKPRAKILNIAGAARTRIDAAAVESKVKRQRNLLKVAEKQLSKLLKVVAKGFKKHQISEALTNRIREQADGARGAVQTLRAGLTG